MMGIAIVPSKARAGASEDAQWLQQAGRKAEAELRYLAALALDPVGPDHPRSPGSTDVPASIS